MPNPLRGVIFSDLDGTFLDDRYRPALDAAALARVAARWRVVWVSSRTAEELVQLQRTMGHTDDAIGENGGVCVSRTERTARALGDTTALDGMWVARVAAPREDVRALVIAAFAAEGRAAHTLDELSVEDLARRSGYAVADAERAHARRASVLLVDTDAEEPPVARALNALRANGCTVVHGGRWISVVRGADKGSTARRWLAQAFGGEQGAPPLVAAIGNADNDEALLAFAAEPFIVRAPDGTYPPRLSALPRAHRLERIGTDGWSEMLDALSRMTGNPS
jgi:predicted mannosyl-3-phosphoglycerate phosphatase (HAD superfamily)